MQLGLEQAFDKMVDKKLNEFKTSLIRSHGGIPVKNQDAVYSKAVDEINLLINSGEKIEQSVITNALDLFGAINAQEHGSVDGLNMTIDILHKLSNGQILSPLTGEDSEWKEVKQDQYVNIRMPKVIKIDGKAYFTECFAFPDGKGGLEFKGKKSWSELSFPVGLEYLQTVIAEDSRSLNEKPLLTVAKASKAKPKKTIGIND